jgi:hypothetical protein
MDDFTLADDDLFPTPGPDLDGMTAINSAGVRFRCTWIKGLGWGWVTVTDTGAPE